MRITEDILHAILRLHGKVISHVLSLAHGFIFAALHKSPPEDRVLGQTAAISAVDNTSCHTIHQPPYGDPSPAPPKKNMEKKQTP